MSELDSIPDWAGYLRQLIDQGRVPEEVSRTEPNATSIAAALSVLHRYLDGRPAQAEMVEGALQIVEQGNAHYIKPLLPVPLEHGRAASSRIAKSIETHRTKLDDLTVSALIDRALQDNPSDSALVRVMEAEAKTRGPEVLRLAARWWPAWAASHIDWVPTSGDADGALLLRVVDRTPTGDLPVMIDAIGKAGADYVNRLVTALATWPVSAQARVKPALQADPAFAGRV
ncbi:MAG: hypothetical protein HOV81_16565 [Kofleriaceae bacterium]|nr:hypothetical protein [Kofleriaceae bacterium]